MEVSIKDRAQLFDLVRQAGGGPHYVYVLRRPGLDAEHGEPFYVGIGQGTRLFSHEEEARDPSRSGGKVEAIRAIWASGKEVVRMIDSIHSVEPWAREEQLINEIGRVADGRGPLTNAQVYSPSTQVDGVELRKYAADYAETGDVNAVPPRFKLKTTRLVAGPSEPRSRTSVFGKIYTVAEENPGVTGVELLELLIHVDFTGNKSAYTQGGRVSKSWLAGYVEGAFFRSDRLHLQEFQGAEAG